MSDTEKQILKMKLVKTPDVKGPCSLCYFNPQTCFDTLWNICGVHLFHFEPSTPIKIEIVEDKT